ncbi:response regulator transcription factor [Nakamurella sp. PAMC28650]|nr:response regulator transcription factor [Nakamurella sp. PAMC28650]
MVRALIVDDQPVFRRAALLLLRSLPGLQVVGEAASGEESVRMAAELRPGLILMDVQLPGINGMEATRRILTGQPDVRVILLSTRDAADLPADHLSCGAVAFVRKQDIEPGRLLALARPGATTPDA